MGTPDQATPVTNVVLASRSPLVNVGLQHLLLEIACDSERCRVRVTDDLDDALTADASVIIVDVDDLQAVVLDLEQRKRSARIVLISCRSHVGGLPDLLKSRVCAFVSLRSPIERCRSLLREIVNCRFDRTVSHTCANCPLPQTLARPTLPLTPRELAVFEQIGSGLSTRDIAQELRVSVKTVESHQQSIKRKLRLDDARSLIESATKWMAGEFLPFDEVP